MSTPLRTAACMFCVRFNRESSDPPTCEAFPVEGIPDPIYDGVIAHAHPYPGDHGLQFEGVLPPGWWSQGQEEPPTG